MIDVRHLIIITLVFFGGCAQIPPDRLDMARQLVARAYAQDADTYAPDAYDRASRELRRAETAVSKGEIQEASRWSVKAEQSALAALYRTRQEKRKAFEQQQLPALEPSKVASSPAVPPPEVEPPKKEEQVSQKMPTQPEPPVKVKKARPKEPVKPKPVTRIKVREGESLFMIARRRDVYGDALLWPLIYQANRDQIKDPRQIFPGQELMVPRDFSEADMERARNFARQSKIFPME